MILLQGLTRFQQEVVQSFYGEKQAEWASVSFSQCQILIVKHIFQRKLVSVIFIYKNFRNAGYKLLQMLMAVVVKKIKTALSTLLTSCHRSMLS